MRIIINFTIAALFLANLAGCGGEQQKEDDPYMWLEKVEGKKALEWAKKHNEKAFAELKSDPVFQEIYEKNLSIYNSKERIAYPSIRGKYVYNFWQDEKNPRGVWRRTTLKKYLAGKEDWDVLLDIDELSKKDSVKWVFKGANYLYPEYRYCIVSLSRGGGDAVVKKEFDTRKKEFVENGFYLPEAKGSADWLDYNTLVIGTDFGENSMTTSGYPRIVKLWKRGTPVSEAQTLYEGKKEDMGAWGGVINTPEKNYLLVSNYHTFYTHEFFIMENGKLIKLEIPEDADFEGIFKGQLLISLKTDWQLDGKTYPQGALISIDYDRFIRGAKDFTVIAAPDEKSSISTVSSTKNYLLINMLKNVRSEYYAYSYKNGKWKKQEIMAPEFGTIGQGSTDDFSDRFFFSYTGFLTPSTLYFAGDINSKPIAVKQLPKFFNTDNLRVDQFWAVSKDGTKIPYFQISAKDLKPDGSNPTLIYGYGGFEISLKPSYSATVGTDWLEKGGVYVVANIRGGGEFGPEWHLAALKENRQKAYDDFIAVAEDLVKRQVTSPRHLGIMGGSNGGLLVGAVMVQRPDLYNAVVCEVPLLDMKRYNKLLAGASWMGEYGNPDIPEEWEYISKYSPYQNLKKGQKYPVPFFYTSTRDDRVHPAHARKMVAKMEELGYKVYYYENMEGGHSGGSTNKQRALLNALAYTYLLKQLK